MLKHEAVRFKIIVSPYLIKAYKCVLVSISQKKHKLLIVFYHTHTPIIQLLKTFTN